jgi:hypothetical protein
MCTCGAISTTDQNGKPVIMLGKTLDFYETGFWYGVVSHSSGYEAVGGGIVPQIGVNSGMNEKGLGVLLSFLDYRGPFEMLESNIIPGKWDEDDRALLNAQLLAKCSKVEEAVNFLYDAIPGYPNMPGGNHMLADTDGTIAVVEHCNGEIKHQYNTEDGYASRGNNGVVAILDEQKRLPDDVKKDRFKRSEAMGDTLQNLLNKKINQEEVIVKMKEILSSHRQKHQSEPGNICIHNYALPGARASTHFPLSTVTAVVYNLVDKKMYYTKTNPCQKEWFALGL